MKYHKFYISLLSLSFLTLVNSCTTKVVNKSLNLNWPKASKTCEIKESKVRVYENNKFIKDHILSEHNTDKREDFIKSSLSLALLNLYSRPDAYSINSRILILSNINGKKFQISTIDRTSKSSTLFWALESFFNYYNKDKSFYNSIIKLNSTLPTRVRIGDSLQKYIESNKSLFYKNELSRKIVFKGNQIIRKGESIKRTSLIDLYKRHKSLRKPLIIKRNILSRTGKYSCSYDKRLYENPLIIKRNQLINSNTSGIFVDKDNYFIITSSSSPIKKDFIPGTIISRSKKIHSMNSAVCINENNFVLIHNNFHSEQIINNILKLSPSSTEDIIQTKRWVKLLFPPRNLIEVYGKSGNQKYSSGPYFVETLGLIDIVSWNRSTGYTLFSDPRRNVRTCK